MANFKSVVLFFKIWCSPLKDLYIDGIYLYQHDCDTLYINIDKKCWNSQFIRWNNFKHFPEFSGPASALFPFPYLMVCVELTNAMEFNSPNSKNIRKWIFTSLFMLKKIQEFDIIQVLFKPSSIFQRFDWYNSHSQGEDVEWKIYITV